MRRPHRQAPWSTAAPPTACAAGHLWVYASDVVAVTFPKPDEEAPSLISVADQRGILLGTALYSPSSQIALRLVSREALDHAAWLELLASRLRAAIARRKPMLDEANDACRLCFSEADELPGLVVDKYGDLISRPVPHQRSARTRCERSLRARPARGTCACGHFRAPRSAHSRAGGSARAQPRPLVARRSRKCPVTATQFHLNGLAFHYDANAGQKTGAFLDQRTNYAAAREWAQRLGAAKRESGGRALDVCCYQGGFALHLAQVCRQVTGIDASRASLEVAERNLAGQSHRASPPKSTGSRPTPSRFCATGRRPASSSTPSFSIRRPSPKPSAPSKARCAATRS